MSTETDKKPVSLKSAKRKFAEMRAQLEAMPISPRDWPEGNDYGGRCHQCNLQFSGPKFRIMGKICRECSEKKKAIELARKSNQSTTAELSSALEFSEQAFALLSGEYGRGVWWNCKDLIENLKSEIEMREHKDAYRDESKS